MIEEIGKKITLNPFYSRTIVFPIIYKPIADEHGFEIPQWQDQTNFAFVFDNPHVVGRFYNFKNTLGKHEYTYAELTGKYKNGKYAELTVMLNSIISASNVVHEHVPNRFMHNSERVQHVEFTAMMRGNTVLGVMYNYNHVPHIDLLMQIKKRGLSGCVVSAHLSKKQFSIFMKSGYSDTDGGIYVYIQNGHTGEVALRVSLVFKCSKFIKEIDTGKYAHARHLSRVPEVLDLAEEALKNLEENEFEEYLRSLPARDVQQRALNIALTNVFTDKQQEKLEDAIKGVTGENGISVIFKLAEYTAKNGYKGISNRLLDKLFDTLKENFVLINTVAA